MTGQENVRGLYGNIGADLMYSLTNGTGFSNARLKSSGDNDKPKMKLTAEEPDILDGKKGELLQKAMKTIVT